MSDDPTNPPDDGRRGGIAPIAIEDELKRSYLDYAMSVIVSRALPDARDGLKPVHRRILFSMNEQGHTPDRPYVKSARIVGDVMGKYHPHGDTAIYDSLVRMAQPFSMGLVLIDGQGNFGSIDNDPPAAMRYTESRLAKAAMPLLADIDRGTVDFKDNYDGQNAEPVVLPSRIPNLLVNGGSGIAVGMATNIPPHNLGEVIDACLAVIDNPAVSLDELLDIVPGPDFPTGGEIIGRTGARAALMTGRGSVIMRGQAAIETVRKDREAIVITSIPYQVNKSAMVERIAELVREKRIDGVGDLRDESDRDGLRVVVELKRDASAEVLLNQLYRHTPLQSSFPVNMLALNHGRPEQMGLRALLDVFVAFREEVVVRRTKFELAKARDRGHVLVGLAIAVANIDDVIQIIRSSKDPAEARERLTARDWPTGDMIALIELIADPRTVLIGGDRVRLTDEQTRAILALTLSRLTGLGRDEIMGEARELAAAIQAFLDILSSRERVMAIVREELVEVRADFAVPRRSQIVEGDADVEDEDLIVREDMVITVTHGGYVKRTPLATYRTQRRGGKGRSGMATKEEDAVTRVFSASTHAPVLFFSSGGKVYKLKVWRLPVGLPNSRGKAFVNLLPIEPGESITTILPLPEDEASWEGLDVMFATRSGGVRRNKLSDFVQINRNGKIAMKLDEGDSIIGVGLCTTANDVLLTTSLGRCIRFPVDEVRVFAGREFDRRARHPPGRGRQCHLHGHPARGGRQSGRARRLSEIRERPARRPGRRGRRGPRGGGRGRGCWRRGSSRPDARTSGRAEPGRGVHPDGLVGRFRQTDLGLRLPAHGTRRPGPDRPRPVQEGRAAGGFVPDRGRRRDPAGHRRRPADPLSGRGDPHRRAQHFGGDHLPHRRGRACGLGRAARSRRRRGRNRR